MGNTLCFFHKFTFQFQLTSLIINVIKNVYILQLQLGFLSVYNLLPGNNLFVAIRCNGNYCLLKQSNNTRNNNNNNNNNNNFINTNLSSY
jgi:hypothetical protein